MTSLIPTFLGTINLSQAAASFAYWMIQSLAYGTVAALLTWLLAISLLRKARPGLLAAVWLVVLVKFVLPVGPEFSYSLSSLVGAWLPLPAPVPATVPCAAAAVPLELAGPATAGFGDLIVFATVQSTEACATPPATLTSVPPPAPIAAFWSNVPWLSILTAAYLIAVAAFATLQVVAYRRFHSRCRQLPLADTVLRGYVHALCRRVGVRGLPTVRVSEEWPTPFVYGLLSPTLVISVRRYRGPRELEAVLLHEIAHLRRGDLLVRYLQVVVGTVLFFWPVVAWVNRRIDLAREQACDEWALRHGRLSATAYARCLLSAARARRSGWSQFVPAAMAANASHVERRIDMIMNTSTGLRRGRFLSLLAGCGIVVWGGFVLSGANAAMIKAAAVKQDAQSGPAGADVIVESQVLVLDSNGNQLQSSDCKALPMLADLPLIGKMFCGNPTGGHMQMFVARAGSGDNVSHNMNICLNKSQSPEALASFLAGHPTADADANGTLTQGEFDAYHIALAMSAPAGVLGQFPKADVDSDGTLSASEAARLVTLGLQLDVNAKFGLNCDANTAGAVATTDDGQTPHQRIAIAFAGGPIGGTIPPELQAKIDEIKARGGTGQMRIMRMNGGDAQMHTVDPDAIPTCAPKVEVNEADGKISIKVGDGELIVVPLNKDGNVDQTIEDGNRKVIVRRAVTSSDDAKTDDVDVQTIITRVGEPMVFSTSSDDAADGTMPRIALRAMASDMLPPTIWLMANVDTTPSAADVARYVTLAEQTPLADFLTNNPTADTNADGVLTVAERDAFVEKQSIDMRSHLLESMPEADANSDGTLTDEELKTHLMSKTGSDGVWTDGDTTPRMIMMRHGQGANIDQQSSNGRVMIRMHATTSTNSSDNADK
ncbi:MAG: M56 family metallopeptidase [Phycisphaerae bacterium]